MDDSLNPETKFCESCDLRVVPTYKTHETKFPIYGRLENISFQAAYCPFCGSVVCERGFDELFLEKVQQRMKELDEAKLRDANND